MRLTSRSSLTLTIPIPIPLASALEAAKAGFDLQVKVRPLLAAFRGKTWSKQGRRLA